MTKVSRSQIGYFIKQIRKEQSLSQKEFAQRLKTTQSAVARMENGEQNFTTQMLNKISKVLNHSIISVGDKTLDIRVKGGNTLNGSVQSNTSKNGAMGLICASLLNEGTTVLKRIPRIEEVNRMIEVLTSIGVSIRWLDNNTLEVKPPVEVDIKSIDKLAARRTRSAVMFLGPLVHKLKEQGKFSMPHIQGCKLGKRTLAAHKYAFDAMGVTIKAKAKSYSVEVNGLEPAEFPMYESGDTATENAIMLAAKIPGVTTIHMASANYMVQDVCYFLEKCGVKIEGIGTTTLKIHGVSRIKQNIEHANSEDPTESMMWLTAGIMTKSNITVTHCPIEFLRLELLKLQTMGLEYKTSAVYKSQNQRTDLVDIEVFPSKLKAPEMKLYGRPFPGINIDNLPFFVPIATQAEGQTLIHDWIYENRAIYYMDLTKMGAGMILADTHRVFVNGPSQLRAANMSSPSAIRPASAILLAMMAADGTSILRDIYSISRGYEDIANRLNSLGADVRIIK